MTEDRIKEEFEKYLDGEIDTKATIFGYHYETNRKGSKAGYKNMAQGFYAGFRAADRLAKIEVLEEVILRLEDAEQDAYIIAEIKDKLSDLKGEQ